LALCGTIEVVPYPIRCAVALISSTTTRRSRGGSGPQNKSDDFRGQLPAFCLQTGLRRGLVFFDGGTRLFYLGLRFVPHFGYRRGSCLQCLLAKYFLIPENRYASFAQTLLVFRGSRLGGGNIGAGLLDCSFGLAAPLGQHLHQWLVNKHGVGRIQQNQEDNGRYGSEQ
jgi:hypothetical protein